MIARQGVEGEAGSGDRSRTFREIFLDNRSSFILEYFFQSALLDTKPWPGPIALQIEVHPPSPVVQHTERKADAAVAAGIVLKVRNSPLLPHAESNLRGQMGNRAVD